MTRTANQASIPNLRMIAPTLVLGLILASSLPVAQPARAEINLLPHEFECGTSVPPSGPYLDELTAVLFDYDCLTGLLSNPRAVPSVCIHQEPTPASQRHAFAGYCAITYGGSEDDFRAFVGMAVRGTYQNLDLTVHGDVYGLWDYEGDEHPLTANGVSYYDDFDHGYGRSPCETEATHAHSSAWGTSGDTGTAHDKTTVWCF